MEDSGHVLFPDPGLPGDENRQIAAAEGADLAKELLHERSGADHELGREAEDRQVELPGCGRCSQPAGEPGEEA